MPLYEIKASKPVVQIKPGSFRSERELQKLFEDNLEILMGVRFIASEFTTGDRQRGRIDTLGLDQDGSPTIIEYKKTSKETVINQGLFYLDWLVDHKGDFTVAVQEVFGNDIEIDWSHPRLILIAESFSKYDEYAVNRIGANIELWAYRRYGEEILYLDPVFVANPQVIKRKTADPVNLSEDEPVYSLEDHLDGKSSTIRALFEALQERIFQLADESEITEKANKTYISYKHGKNFCEVEPQARSLKMWLDLPFAELDDPHELARDVADVGHYGTGDVEVRLDDLADLEKVSYLVEQAYQQTL